MRRRLLAGPAVLLLAVAPAHAKSETKIEIVPGPAVMSQDERDIVPDPAAGAQHAIILLEETDWNEDHGTGYKFAFHMRAKILSAEGRALADVEIPWIRSSSDLETWWGRTILPDGTSIELRKDELSVRTAEKSGYAEYRTAKAALPGVVPGCVIDYGYVVRGEGFGGSVHLNLQREWPVRRLRYRWAPSPYFPAAYVGAHTEGKAIEIKHDGNSVLITAHDLAPVAEEPSMAPLGEVRASVTLYYTDTSDPPDEYWGLRAKHTAGTLRSFVGNGSAIRDAIAGMSIPPDAGIPDKLHIAYDWIGAKVKNLGLLSAEEEERHDSSKDYAAYDAKSVLRARAGYGRQIDFLFAGIARALGAEADIAFAADRTQRFWNYGLKSMRQFDYTLVAVRAPGEPGDALRFVDAGSGLPFGEVPWPATGGTALICTSKGAATRVIPPSPPGSNRGDTRVTLDLGSGSETTRAKWSRAAYGASAMGRRRRFRDLDPKERKQELDETCRGEGGTEVVAVELRGLDDVAQPLEIACDIEMGESDITPGTIHYNASFMGPWWPATPAFPSATRVFPVVFDYPKADVVSIDVKSPPEFRPKSAPAPVYLTTPFGKYHLVVEKTATGFHVDRTLSLTSLTVPVTDYAALRAFFEDVATGDRTTLPFARGPEAP